MYLYFTNICTNSSENLCLRKISAKFYFSLTMKRNRWVRSRAPSCSSINLESSIEPNRVPNLSNGSASTVEYQFPCIVSNSHSTSEFRTVSFLERSARIEGVTRHRATTPPLSLSLSVCSRILELSPGLPRQMHPLAALNRTAYAPRLSAEPTASPFIPRRTKLLSPICCQIDSLFSRVARAELRLFFLFQSNHDPTRYRD